MEGTKFVIRVWLISIGTIAIILILVAILSAISGR